MTAACTVSIGITIFLWLRPIHTPLWLDETGSWWQISGSFHAIWARQIDTLAFPTYAWILWACSKIFGTSEVGLRLPSVLAMLGAAYLLYRAARELFSRELALVATVIFCVNPIIGFTAIDARPYAFSVLTANAALYVLMRMRRRSSLWMAALLGLLCGTIASLQFLFVVIVPAIAVCLIAFHWRDKATLWRQLCVGFGAFSLAMAPLLPGLRVLFIHRISHVFETAPAIEQLRWILLPEPLPWVFVGTLLIAALLRHYRPDQQGSRWETPVVIACLALGLIPIGILYGISEWTPVHMFSARHCAIGAPGIALLWTVLIQRYFPRPIMPLFCVALAAATCWRAVRSPSSLEHGYTWKYALEAAQKNISEDHAPVLMCSDFPESDSAPMPTLAPEKSKLFAPLSYYHMTARIVPLPRSLNSEAVRVGSQFISEARERHERFLAMGFIASFPTLRWLKKSTAGSYDATQIGIYDGVAIVEFKPHSQMMPNNAKPAR